MANKVLLKKSSVASKVPLTTDLDYGELALNYTDGKLYFKNASNIIKSFTIDDSVVTLTGTQTLTNKTLSSAVLTGTLTAGGSTGTAGQILQSTGTGVQWSSAGTGSVTSVGLSLPALFTVTNSPVTSSGTLTATFASQTANTFLAAPDGTAGAPTMRSIVAADIPTLNQNTTGSAGSVANALTIGTGLSGTSYNGSAAVTIAIDSTVTTLTGSQTLTNKTLTFPIINNIREGFTSTATAAGTTTLTSSSNHYQRFTGSTTQTVVLPVTSTLAAGVSYSIENASTGNLTVNSSGGNLVITVIPGVTVQCMCIGTTLTTAADWDAEYTEFAAITGTGSNVLSVSPALTGTATFANATSTSGFLAVGNASVTTNRIYATNGAGVASILGNNTFQSTTGLAGVSGTTTSAGSGHLGYFNGTVRAGVFGAIGTYTDGTTNYAGYFDGRVGLAGDLVSFTASINIANTTSTTVNAFGAATTLAIGGASGTLTIGNATITGTNATTLNLNGASPSIVTSSTGTASVFNTNALTGNLFGAATTATLGYSGTAASTTNISTGAVAASTTKTVNIGTGGAANSTTNVNIGSANGGTTTVNNSLVAPSVATPFLLNKNTIDTSYTVPSGYNVIAAGPVTINNGITVTIPSGSTWVVI